ncbi:MAG TPA: ABC transporter ATP-binding protein [Acidimicrobiia bacterium]|nr:ABC transporter ATP-binding protein [Acidimicrobiia bacterium]
MSPAPVPHPSTADSPTGAPDVPPAIEVRGAGKLFDGGAGVQAFDLTVPKGSILGLIGPSGAGKTTAVRLLTGLLAPDDGEVRVFGEDPTGFSPVTRQRLGYLPQDSALYPTLTIAENLSFFAAQYGLTGRARRRRVAAVLDLVDLTDTAGRRLSEASGGMRRRAGLAAALVHEPELLFLDEPTAGLDPILRHALWNGFDALRNEGVTLVVTTQYVGEASRCDEIVLLSDGAVAARGGPEDLRRQAYGGEIIDVRFDRVPGRDAVARIAERIDAVSYRGIGIGEVEFVVPDAGTASAEITEAAGDVDATVVEVERRYPEFDEVFVRIVGEHREDEQVSA